MTQNKSKNQEHLSSPQMPNGQLDKNPARADDRRSDGRTPIQLYWEGVNNKGRSFAKQFEALTADEQAAFFEAAQLSVLYTSRYKQREVKGRLDKNTFVPPLLSTRSFLEQLSVVILAIERFRKTFGSGMVTPTEAAVELLKELATSGFDRFANPLPMVAFKGIADELSKLNQRVSSIDTDLKGQVPRPELVGLGRVAFQRTPRPDRNAHVSAEPTSQVGTASEASSGASPKKKGKASSEKSQSSAAKAQGNANGTNEPVSESITDSTPVDDSSVPVSLDAPKVDQSEQATIGTDSVKEDIEQPAAA